MWRPLWSLLRIITKKRDMWKLTKQYFKNLWVNLWSKTTIDEKAIETMAEIQKR